MRATVELAAVASTVPVDPAGSRVYVTPPRVEQLHPATLTDLVVTSDTGVTERLL